MEHASSEGQQVVINGQQLQVLQMNQATHMIQGSNGQQIMVHAVPSGTPLQVPFCIIFAIHTYICVATLNFFIFICSRLSV